MEKDLNRSQIAALKAYPPTYTTVKRHAKRVQSELVDTHKPVRAIFQQGYGKAIKDIRDWVENYAYDVVASFNCESEDADYWTGKHTTCVDLLEMIDKS